MKRGPHGRHRPEEIAVRMKWRRASRHVPKKERLDLHAAQMRQKNAQSRRKRADEENRRIGG